MSINYECLETGEEILEAIESLKAELKPEPFEKIINTAVISTKEELEVLKKSKATGSVLKTKKDLITSVKCLLGSLDSSLKLIYNVSSAESTDISSSNAKKTIKAAEVFLAGPNMDKNPAISLKIYGFVNFALKERLSESKTSQPKIKAPGKRLENLPKFIEELTKMLKISGRGATSFNKSQLLNVLEQHRLGNYKGQLGLPEDSKLPIVIDGKKTEKAVSGWVTVLQNAVLENNPQISKYIKADGKFVVLV